MRPIGTFASLLFLMLAALALPSAAPAQNTRVTRRLGNFAARRRRVCHSDAEELLGRDEQRAVSQDDDEYSALLVDQSHGSSVCRGIY